jgi:hypothetical protein
MYLTRIAGFIATAFGVLFLLYIFAWCSMVPPDLKGAAWWGRVLRVMFSQEVLGTALGIVCILGGVFLLFFRPRPRPTLLAVIVMAALAVLILLGVAGS